MRVVVQGIAYLFSDDDSAEVAFGSVDPWDHWWYGDLPDSPHDTTRVRDSFALPRTARDRDRSSATANLVSDTGT